MQLSIAFSAGLSAGWLREIGFEFHSLGLIAGRLGGANALFEPQAGFIGVTQASGQKASLTQERRKVGKNVQAGAEQRFRFGQIAGFAGVDSLDEVERGEESCSSISSCI